MTASMPFCTLKRWLFFRELSLQTTWKNRAIYCTFRFCGHYSSWLMLSSSKIHVFITPCPNRKHFNSTLSKLRRRRFLIVSWCSLPPTDARRNHELDFLLMWTIRSGMSWFPLWLTAHVCLARHASDTLGIFKFTVRTRQPGTPIN